MMAKVGDAEAPSPPPSPPPPPPNSQTPPTEATSSSSIRLVSRMPRMNSYDNLSEDTTDGFSLVDDGGDSLMGSDIFDEVEIISEGSTHSYSTTTNATSQTGHAATATRSREILLPASHKSLQGARTCFWVLWVLGTASMTIALLIIAKDLSEEKVDDKILPQIVALILAFSSLMAISFLWYDRTVRRRDSDLTKEAIRSRDVLLSLFPHQFHDRLFRSIETGIASTHYASMAQSSEFQTFLQSGFLQAGPSSIDVIDSVPVKSPILNGDGSFVRVAQSHSRPAVEPTHRALTSPRDAVGQLTNDPLLFENNSFTNEQVNQLVTLTKSGSLKSVSGRSIRKAAESGTQRLRSLMGAEIASISMQSDHVGSAAASTKDEPIADLFPDATVMFADIAGFTAWSSAREPAQVFKLLEAIYRSFDKLAKKQKVFKVETIGDCYVAVTGLPDPQPDHAVIMSKFAKGCMQKMKEMTRQLEVSLGPETADLSMRFGLHSGPVTAGVLRGEKSRFQLFGDTVNFASRMESTGQRNRIQASQATSDLLLMAGKGHWVHQRDDLVNAKGKGQVQTYWIVPRSKSSLGSCASIKSFSDRHENMQDGGGRTGLARKTSKIQLKSRPRRSSSREKSRQSGSIIKLLSSRRSVMSTCNIWDLDSSIDDDEDLDDFEDSNRQERLIEWNVEILSGLLKRIVAQRQASVDVKPSGRCRADGIIFEKAKARSALDEITEIIPLAKLATSEEKEKAIDPHSIVLPDRVEEQLREYVTMIACMYRDNFFHNFEHASHVLMSSQRLLQRVINADRKRAEGNSCGDYSEAIASDPVTQFAIVFSALIHDVDHTGVPNSQLVKEKAHIAALYKNKSIAEQNSLDLAWDLLMSREYSHLQQTIFATHEEFHRFRQLVVNVVLATDIFDPDMIRVRNSRWEKAFGESQEESPLSGEETKSLKATIVIEYIMQASDVSHTMQHWHLYQKWNERLFEEMYSAYQVRRSDVDPSIGWYKGELWFFDNYIIPLARKLKDCGVFGAASDECLKYALENRKEWETKGEEIVEGLVSKHAMPL